MARTYPKRILMSPGGGLFDFIEEFGKDRNDHIKYIIDGPCVSACTMILGTIPSKDVCVTPYAVLGFHAAFVMEKNKRTFSRDGTELVWIMYPQWAQDWLREHGWVGPTVDQDDLIWMPASELQKHFKTC